MTAHKKQKIWKGDMLAEQGHAQHNTAQKTKQVKTEAECAAVRAACSRASQVALRPIQARCGLETRLSLLCCGKHHKGMRPDGGHPQLLDFAKL